MEIFTTDMYASSIEGCFVLLSEEERIRAEGLVGNVRHRFVSSRAFRRRILGPEAEILTEENGRPFVKGNPVFFSMSHSDALLVMAVDIYPVGIDVELMKERNFAKLSSWFFGEHIADCEGFYKHWTRFEAGLKLAGMTLFSKGAPVPKHLHSEALGGYMLSFASNNEISLPLSVTLVQPEAKASKRM
jgi:phosphopantetheinyl transferase